MDGKGEEEEKEEGKEEEGKDEVGGRKEVRNESKQM